MSAGPLYPTWPATPTVPQINQTAPPVAYPPSVAFDFARGDFVIDGRGDLEPQEGYAAWATWCAKAALTQRLAYPVYTANYGTDLSQVFATAGRAATENALTAALTRALLADPRTASVGSFSVIWQGDAATVSFLVTPTVGTAATITLQLTF